MRKTTITLFVVLAVAAAPAIVDAAMSTAAGVGGSALSGTGRQALLYDQTNDPGGNGAPDQDFEAAFDQYDCEGADDFDVTWADGWNVQQVQTVGTYSTTGPVATAKLVIYADAGGAIGAQSCAYSGIAPTSSTGGSLVVDLPTDCFVGPGMAWVAVQSQLDFGTAGQHFWSNRSTQSFTGAMWQNPGDGFASGCTSWNLMTVCGVGGGVNPDFLFQIWGTEAQGPTPTPPPPSTAEPVPSLNTYGIVAMVLLLVGVGILVMWRRS